MGVEQQEKLVVIKVLYSLSFVVASGDKGP